MSGLNVNVDTTVSVQKMAGGYVVYNDGVPTIVTNLNAAMKMVKSILKSAVITDSNGSPV
jgi:hypothetical protein